MPWLTAIIFGAQSVRCWLARRSAMRVVDGVAGAVLAEIGLRLNLSTREPPPPIAAGQGSPYADRFRARAVVILTRVTFLLGNDDERPFGADRSVNRGCRIPRPIPQGQRRRAFQRTSTGGPQGPVRCTAVHRIRSRSAPCPRVARAFHRPAQLGEVRHGGASRRRALSPQTIG